MQWILGTIFCDLSPNDKVKDRIIYFLVNVSSKPLEVATSHFAAA